MVLLNLHVRLFCNIYGSEIFLFKRNPPAAENLSHFMSVADYNPLHLSLRVHIGKYSQVSIISQL